MTMIKAGSIIAGMLLVSVLMALLTNLLTHRSEQINCAHSQIMCSFSRCWRACQDEAWKNYTSPDPKPWPSPPEGVPR